MPASKGPSPEMNKIYSFERPLFVDERKRWSLVSPHIRTRGGHKDCDVRSYLECSRQVLISVGPSLWPNDNHVMRVDPFAAFEELLRRGTVIQFSAGYFHFVFLVGMRDEFESSLVHVRADHDDQLVVYGWGDSGALCTGKFEDCKVPERIDSSLVPLEPSDKVTQVACGGYHTLLLSSNGTVLSCGDNGCGQLGLGDLKSRSVLEPVKFGNLLSSSTITGISCGGFFSYALTASNKLLSWGSSEFGQLGVGVCRDRSIPSTVELDGDVEIASMLCGFGTVILLSSDGRVFSAGRNAEGECGVGDLENRLTFSRVQGFVDPYPRNSLDSTEEQERVVAIGGGDRHFLALTESNFLFGWGSNGNGQLALKGRREGKKVKVPRLITALNGVLISRLFTGRGNRSFVLSENGTIFLWGSDDRTLAAVPPFPVEALRFQHVMEITSGATISFALSYNC